MAQKVMTQKAGFVSKGCDGLTKRRNLVIEGLVGDSDDEMRAATIEIGNVLEMTIYNEEIEEVVHMARIDQANKTPGPVLVTISRPILRNTILHKIGKLMNNDNFEKVFMNADEDIETRWAKSFL